MTPQRVTLDQIPMEIRQIAEAAALVLASLGHRHAIIREGLLNPIWLRQLEPADDCHLKIWV